MTPEAIEIREHAKALAREAGYRGPAESPSEWRASPGRFEGEPWYLPYFYAAVMNGDGEPFDNGDFTDCDVLDVTAFEIEAFDLSAYTAAVAVTYSVLGFIGLVELTTDKLAELRDSYARGGDDE